MLMFKVIKTFHVYINLLSSGSCGPQSTLMSEAPPIVPVPFRVGSLPPESGAEARHVSSHTH